MTAPERIWAWPIDKGARVTTLGGPPDLAVCYTRADLPPTLSAALALPEVRALVEASKGLLFAHDHGNGLEGWHNTRERMRAALRAIEEGGE